LHGEKNRLFKKIEMHVLTTPVLSTLMFAGEVNT